MKKTVAGILVLAIIGGAGWYAYAHRQAADGLASTKDLGMYPYVCDNGSAFILSPLEGMQHVQVSADAQGMFTGTATLALVSGTAYAGAAPDGQQVSLTGDGETVRLIVGAETTACSPKPSDEGAPWNWGDPIAAP
jgi:hypothetical protein